MRRIALCLVALALTASCAGDDDDGARPALTSTSVDATLSDVERADLDYDPSVPLDATSQPTQVQGVALERIEFTTNDATRVPGYFLADSGQRGACLIVQHGSGTNKGDGLVLGGILRGFGVNVSVLSIDAREHGERRGSAPAAPADAEAWSRVVHGTAIDLRRALDYLEARPECDPARLGLVGISMGGFTGVLTAAVDGRVRATALISAGADYRTLVTTRGGLYSYLYINDEAALEAGMAFFDPIDPLRFVADIAPRPVLMINGEADRLIPAVSADALHDAAGRGSEELWHRGGHSIANHDRDTNTQLFQWLEEHLVS